LLGGVAVDQESLSSWRPPGAAWRWAEWWQPPVTAAYPVDIVAIDEDHFRSCRHPLEEGFGRQ